MGITKQQMMTSQNRSTVARKVKQKCIILVAHTRQGMQGINEVITCYFSCMSAHNDVCRVNFHSLYKSPLYCDNVVFAKRKIFLPHF